MTRAIQTRNCLLRGRALVETGFPVHLVITNSEEHTFASVQILERGKREGTSHDPVSITSLFVCDRTFSCSINPETVAMADSKVVIRTLTPVESDNQRLRKDIKWNGWGYKDTEFKLNAKGVIALTGDRYQFSGQLFPELRSWVETVMGLSVNHPSPPQPQVKVIPQPIMNHDFVEAIRQQIKLTSFADEDRLFHGHGATCYEVYQLRYGSFARIPDMVIWPDSHEDVEFIMHAAVRFNVGIIPFGGGTSVSNALECPREEKRMIVSLDMKQMNRILDINREDMTVTLEAGCVGKDLEITLASEGLTCGHEPDSMEFSTAGGWVATRASGMKKNVYGNIEDILVHVKMVTPQGTIQRGCKVPRMSAGPDIHNIILGSEGTLGVITNVTFRLRPKPRYQTYGSILFPNFKSGVQFMHEVARRRCAPASIRLMDNLQFQMGHSLKASSTSYTAAIVDFIKKIYVTKIKGFKPDEMCAATLLFEGDDKTAMDVHEKLVYSLAAQYGGLPAGAENGERGYFLTYVIAYLRDLGFDYHYIAESFETAVPWQKVEDLCRNVKSRIYQSCREQKLSIEPFVSCRVTQTYDTGACVYFYFGFVFRNVEDPCAVFHRVEEDARIELLRNGGSISHHHGVGKLRKAHMRNAVSDVGLDMMRAIKRSIDPANILCANNCYI